MDFEEEVGEKARSNARYEPLKGRVHEFLAAFIDPIISCNLSWLRCLIIHYPKDLNAMWKQAWRFQSDFIIDTGVAWPRATADPKNRGLMVLDLNHIHDHVLGRVKAYRGLNLPSSLSLTEDEAGFVCTTLLELLAHG